LNSPIPPELAERLQDEARLRKSPNVRPRDAATLILLDRSGDTTLVLLGRRHAGHKFMPGKYVFPGGRIEPSDRQLAAIRETFEETGLAIGVTDHGAPSKAPEGAWARFAATGVFPALDGLDFLARAITPPRRPKRFDTRFFVADAAQIAHRTPDVVNPDAELVELVWTPLEDATKLDLPLITHVVLAELAAATKSGMDRFRARPFYRARHNRWGREEL
jgi:8-oxo-dGTP pyrophosphatase MutT (NUDIX family)